MKLMSSLPCKRQLFLLNPSRNHRVLQLLPPRQTYLKTRHFFLAYPLSREDDSHVGTQQPFNSQVQISRSTEPVPRKTSNVWSVFNPAIGDIDIQRIKAKHEFEAGTSGSDPVTEELKETRDRLNGKDRSPDGKDVASSSIENSNEMIDEKQSDQRSSVSEDNHILSTKATSIRNSYVQVNGKANSVRGSARRVKNKKKKISFVCTSCGHSNGQWWGYCPNCKERDTLQPFTEQEENEGKLSGMEVSENVVRSWLPNQTGEFPLKLAAVNQGINQQKWRIPLSGDFGGEVDRVIGGGLVPGSLVLVGGDPGVGKSTLLLQIASLIAKKKDNGESASVVYVSGEESVEQIGNRAARMKIDSDDLYIYSNTDIEDIMEKICPLSPAALIIDSIQTVYLKGVVGSAGALTQVKECTSALLRFAKKTNVSVILIGHVTKSGEIAGPRTLEHIVDVVLYMEGEKSSSHRLLRPVKNRYGSIDELGVFEMSPSGLKPVSNPAEMFLREQLPDSEVLAGLAVSVIMDGSRSFLIEIQALCATSSSVTSRHVNGIPTSRADMIISVLNKQAGLMLQQHSIFLNVIGGVTLTETSGDLAIAAAICSSFMEFPIPNNIAFVGEIGLGGELRTVPRMDKRVSTLAQMGYKKCVVPKQSLSSLIDVSMSGMEVVGCSNVKDLIKSVFTNEH